MKLIGYLRVSTDQQADSGLGLEAQKHVIVEYIKKHKICSYEFFEDAGLSGTIALDKRPGMVSAIGSLRKGDILAVAKRDRLGRDMLVLAMIEAAVKRKGARIISTAGEGTDSDDPASALFRHMIDGFAIYERLIIGARTKAALKVKKEKGQRVGHIPFGSKLSADGIHLEPNDEEQRILKLIRKLRIQSLSIREIAKAMNIKGKLNRGSRWNHASVHRMIKIA